LANGRFKHYFSLLQEKWLRLSANEQRTVRIGGTALLVLMIYQFIWSPLLLKIDTLRKQIVAEQHTLTQLQSMDAEIKQLAKNGPKPIAINSPVMLLSYLQNQINQAGLAGQLTELKQATNNAIEMHFQKIAFDALATLIMQMTKEAAIHVAQFSVKAETAPGVVNADIVINTA